MSINSRLKNSNSKLEKKTISAEENLSYDSKSFVQILQNVIYYGMTEKYDNDYHNLTLWMRFKYIVHNSIFVQIFICVFISSILFAILAYHSKLSPLEIPVKIFEDDIIQNKVKDDEVKVESDLNVIRLEDYKIEEFINKIKN